MPIRLKKHRRGATTVELSITIPVLLGLFMSMVFFVQCYLFQSTAEMAAYAGSREGIVVGSTESDMREAAVEQLRLIGVADFDVQVKRTTEYVRVTIDIPLSKNSWSTGYFFPLNISIVGMAQLKRPDS